MPAAETERDPGNPELRELGEQPPGHRGDVALVLLARQRSDPGVEDLDRRGAGLHLRAQRRHRDVREAAGELVEERWVGEHERLRAPLRVRGTALDEVAGERERPAREADQRHVEL